MKKLVTIILFLSIYLGLQAHAISNTDMLKMYVVGAEEAWEHGNFKAAIGNCEKVFSLNLKTPDHIYFIHGQSLFNIFNILQAKTSLNRYVKMAGKGGCYYRAALNTIRQIERVNFSFDKKEWLIYTNNLSFETYSNWVKKLGGNWRMPTLAELAKLHKRKILPENIGSAWASDKTGHKESAWAYSFSGGMPCKLGIFHCYSYNYSIAVLDIDRILINETKIVTTAEGKSHILPLLDEMVSKNSVVSQANSQKFRAAGKNWVIGQSGMNWRQTQKWLESLGIGWRAPKISELQMLYQEFGEKSPIGKNWAWSTISMANSAFYYDFLKGKSGTDYLSARYNWLLAVGVKE